MSDLPRWYALEAEQLKAEIVRLRAGLQLIADDTHRLMNEVARQTAASILGGKPVGAADQPNGATGCICKGNWRAIVKEMEPWLDKKFTDQHGQEWTFYGIVHGSDDYYYGVARAGETHLLSCVGALESYGYEPVATDPTKAAP